MIEGKGMRAILWEDSLMDIINWEKRSWGLHGTGGQLFKRASTTMITIYRKVSLDQRKRKDMLLWKIQVLILTKDLLGRAINNIMVKMELYTIFCTIIRIMVTLKRVWNMDMVLKLILIEIDLKLAPKSLEYMKATLKMARSMV